MVKIPSCKTNHANLTYATKQGHHGLYQYNVITLSYDHDVLCIRLLYILILFCFSSLRGCHVIERFSPWKPLSSSYDLCPHNPGYTNWFGDPNQTICKRFIGLLRFWIGRVPEHHWLGNHPKTTGPPSARSAFGVPERPR